MQTEGHIYDQKFVYRKWSIGPRGAYFIFPITGVALRQERCLKLFQLQLKHKRKRAGSPSFQDQVSKKRRTLGTRMGGEPHQNSITEQVYEDAVTGLG